MSGKKLFDYKYQDGSETDSPTSMIKDPNSKLMYMNAPWYALWDSETGQCVKRIKNTGYRSPLALLKNGTFLACSNGVYNLNKEEMVLTLNNDIIYSEEIKKEVSTYSKDYLSLLTLNKDGIIIRDSLSGKVRKSFKIKFPSSLMMGNAKLHWNQQAKKLIVDIAGPGFYVYDLSK